jgi:hypothetical protein
MSSADLFALQSAKRLRPVHNKYFRKLGLIQEKPTDEGIKLKIDEVIELIKN